MYFFIRFTRLPESTRRYLPSYNVQILLNELVCGGFFSLLVSFVTEHMWTLNDVPNEMCETGD